MASLTSHANADILSDMKTFTVRDLDRHPGVVLDTCEREGEVEIRRRNGSTFAMVPKGRRGATRPLPDFRARMKAAGMKPLSEKQTRRLDKLIAGE